MDYKHHRRKQTPNLLLRRNNELNLQAHLKGFFCINVFVSSSQSLLAKVWVMLIKHYVCGLFFFFFLQNVTQSTGKTITNLRLMSLSPTALLAQDFFFTSSVLLQCAELFFFGFFLVMETSFSTTLDSNRGFGFDQHINVLETFEMKMFILRLYHNYLCKVFI